LVPQSMAAIAEPIAMCPCYHAPRAVTIPDRGDHTI
jgi:hypothetical protein